MKTIELETRDSVVWLWLSRPRHLNAMNGATLDELHQAFAALGQDESVRAIVVTGRGPAFSAGFDVAWMANLDAETIAREMGDVEVVYDTIESCPKPVIAAVQGVAVGGGLLLALVADLRLAAAGATFGAPEVKIGIFPPLSLASRLERVVGVGAAKRMVLGGDPIDATEALRIGLVERVLSPESLYAEAQALAAQLAALSPMAVQLAKRAFAAARGPDYAAWERAQFAACWAQPEREAAMQFFLRPRNE